MQKKENIKSSQELLAEWKDKFQGLIGRKATFYTPGEKPRQVVIVEATDRFVRLQYKPMFPMHKVTFNTCVTYLSLICGEEKLEVKEIVSREVVLLAG